MQDCDESLANRNVRTASSPLYSSFAAQAGNRKAARLSTVPPHAAFGSARDGKAICIYLAPPVSLGAEVSFAFFCDRNSVPDTLRLQLTHRVQVELEPDCQFIVDTLTYGNFTARRDRAQMSMQHKIFSSSSLAEPNDARREILDGLGRLVHSCLKAFIRLKISVEVGFDEFVREELRDDAMDASSAALSWGHA